MREMKLQRSLDVKFKDSSKGNIIFTRGVTLQTDLCRVNKVDLSTAADCQRQDS
jgi:hypothetical protein